MSRNSTNKSPKKRDLSKGINNAISENSPSSSAIKLRYDYGKKLSPKSVNNFKVPKTPKEKSCDDGVQCFRMTPTMVSNSNLDEQDRESVASSNEVAEIYKSKNSREEFYKYLGIDTNPPHEKQSPASTAETNSSNRMRRSLRVKIQQSIANRLARPIEATNETKNCQNDKNTKNRLRNVESVASNEQNPKRSKRMNEKEIQSPVSKLIKISYNKNSTDRTMNASSTTIPKEYKSISLVRNSGGNTTNGCHVFERRTYNSSIDKADQKVMELKSKYVYRSKILANSCSQQINADNNSNENNVSEPIIENITGIKSIKDEGTTQPKPYVKTNINRTRRKVLNINLIQKRYIRYIRRNNILRSHIIKMRLKLNHPKNTAAQLRAPIESYSEIPSNVELQVDQNSVKQNIIEENSLKQRPLTNNRYLEECTFSPTSITHSNASTDSAIADSNGCANSNAEASVKIQQSTSHVSDPIGINPFSGERVDAILQLPNSNHQSFIVVQETKISVWRMTAQRWTIFGDPQRWQCIGQTERRCIGTAI